MTEILKKSSGHFFVEKVNRWRHLTFISCSVGDVAPSVDYFDKKMTAWFFQDFSQKSSAWFFQDFRTRWRRGCARATFYKSFEITETTLHTLKCFYFNSILIFLQLKNFHLCQFQISYINFLNHIPTLFLCAVIRDRPWWHSISSWLQTLSGLATSVVALNSPHCLLTIPAF